MTNTPDDQPLTRRLVEADLGHLADELPDPVGDLRDPSTGLLTL
jgi:hypothetical protein